MSNWDNWDEDQDEDQEELESQEALEEALAQNKSRKNQAQKNSKTKVEKASKSLKVSLKNGGDDDEDYFDEDEFDEEDLDLEDLEDLDDLYLDDEEFEDEEEDAYEEDEQALGPVGDSRDEEELESLEAKKEREKERERKRREKWERQQVWANGWDEGLEEDEKEIEERQRKLREEAQERKRLNKLKREKTAPREQKPVLREAPFDLLTATKPSSFAEKLARAKKILAEAEAEEEDEEDLEEQLIKEVEAMLPINLAHGDEFMANFEQQLRDSLEKKFDEAKTHTPFYQSANHFYFIVPPKVLDEVNITRLRMLYTPLVGLEAVQLYTFLYDECHLRYYNEDNLGLYKGEILEILGMDFDDFYRAFTYLEQAKLLEHHVNRKKDPDITTSVIKLLAPMTPEEFKKNTTFWHSFVLRAGGKRAKLIRGHLKETDPDYVLMEMRPKRKYKARKPRLSPPHSNLFEMMRRGRLDPKYLDKERPVGPNLWKDWMNPKKPRRREPRPTKVADSQIFKEKLYQLNYEIFEGYDKKILWLLPDYELENFAPIQITPEIEEIYKEIRKSYPNIELSPQLALALLNDNEPFHHAGKLLGSEAHPNLDNCLHILQAEGFPKASLNLITDYAFSQNGVININFVDKISKNFIEKGVYDPLSIATHLRKATDVKARLKITNALKAAKNLSENLSPKPKIEISEEQEKELLASYESQYKHFDFEYQEEEAKKQKKKKVIKQILRTGRRRRRR